MVAAICKTANQRLCTEVSFPLILAFRNIQQPTSNNQHPALARVAVLGCSMLDVGCWMFQSRPISLCVLLLAVLLGGCVSKSKADARARAAFMAGQQQALVRMQQTLAPSVTVNGEVRNRVVPWTEGMTLAKALVAADYYGAKD